MTQNIYIGVDGGGTQSKIRIEDESGNLIDKITSGPANIRLSIDESFKNIFAALDEALSSKNLRLNDPQYAFHAGFGLAGYEVKEARSRFLAKPHPFKTLATTSDSHVACLGAHKGKDGAILIVGTGAVGYQILNGKGMKVGGFGFPCDDDGSGAWLGMQAVKLAFQWLDSRLEKSPLAVDVYAYFNNDFDKLITFANQATSTEFAKLAPLVINHAQQEEIAAVRLMKKAAHFIDRINHGLIKQRDTEKFPTALTGGISPFIEPWLNEKLRESIVSHNSDAASGAILFVKEYIQSKALLSE